MRRILLFEADDDNTTSTTGGANNTTATKTDTTDFSDDDFTIGDGDNADNAKKEDNEEKTEDEPKDDTDNQDDENQDTDDNQEDTGDDEDGEDQEQDENPTEDNMYGGSSEDTEKTDPNSLKSKDREIFDNLSIEEQQIKIRELKTLFSDLHSNISSLIDKLNQISVDADELSPQVRRTIAVLSDMKNDVSFYILNLYDHKSYMENDTMFNYLLLKLNGIQDVIKNIKNELISDN